MKALLVLGTTFALFYTAFVFFGIAGVVILGIAVVIN